MAEYLSTSEVARYLVIPAAFMSHERVSSFLASLVDDLRAEARREHPGYSFETLGRVEPLLPHAGASS